LTSVVIPESVSDIADNAFRGCQMLADVDGFVIVRQCVYAYYGDESIVHIPDGVTSIGESAFSWCTSLTSVVIPEGVTSIGKSAFGYCKSLTSVVIPESVTSIGREAFQKCESLTSVVIPESVTSIGGLAFYGCSSLTGVVLPEGVTSIGVWAFHGCSSLTSVVIPEGVTCIERGAFEGCTSLTSVVLPESVTSVEEEAFFKCSELKTVDFMGAIPTLGSRVFQDCTQLVLKPEIYFTEQKLEVEWAVGIPCDSTRAMAYAWLYQSGKAWADAVNTAAEYHAEEIAEEIYTLLKGSTEVSSKTGDNAAKFIVKWPRKVRPEQIKKLHGLLQDWKCKKAVKLLETDIGTAELLKQGENAGEEQPQNPVEQLVHANWSYTDQVKKLKKYIKKGIKYRGTEETCSPEAVIFAIVGYSNQIPQQRKGIAISDYKDGYFPIHLEPIADQVAAALDQEELLTLLEKLTFEEKIGDCAVALGRYADAQRAERLASQIQKWAKWYDYGLTGRQNIILARGALMLNDTRPALLHMEKVGRLEDYAKLRGTDADTLRDTVLAEFGLDAQGRKEYDLGNKTVAARLNPDLTLSLYDTATDKIVKSIPKKGAEPEKYEAAKTDFADLKKNIKKVVKSRSDLLLEDFLSGKVREAGGWKQAYLTNPVLNQVAQLLVWNQGNKTFTLKGQNAIGSDGQAYTLTEEPVGVAHPIMMTKEEQSAWQNYFTENHLKQPFEQVWEPQYDPDEIASNRYEEIELPILKFSNKQKHGIDLWGATAYSDDFGVTMKDCKLSMEPSEWCFNPYDDMSFTLGEFTVEQFTRYTNHIVYLLDKWTVAERILQDDVSVVPLLGSFTAAQISEFIRLATEKGCTNVTALLLEYQNEHFGQFDPMAEFTLGE
jgi:hypothetical protein